VQWAAANPPGRKKQRSGLACVPRITRVWQSCPESSTFMTRSSRASTGPILSRVDRRNTSRDAGKRRRARAHRPRLHLLRPARDRQDHCGPHHGRCLNCEQGPRSTLRRLRQLQGNRRRRSVDVIEIDAASNRGITKCGTAGKRPLSPGRDAFKVFIVDEAHQITSEAFNALLKTLEERPSGWSSSFAPPSPQDTQHDRLALPAVFVPLGRV